MSKIVQATESIFVRINITEVVKQCPIYGHMHPMKSSDGGPAQAGLLEDGLHINFEGITHGLIPYNKFEIRDDIIVNTDDKGDVEVYLKTGVIITSNPNLTLEPITESASEKLDITEIVKQCPIYGHMHPMKSSDGGPAQAGLLEDGLYISLCEEFEPKLITSYKEFEIRDDAIVERFKDKDEDMIKINLKTGVTIVSGVTTLYPIIEKNSSWGSKRDIGAALLIVLFIICMVIKLLGYVL